MIKARFGGLLLIGLERMNIERLQQDMPIHVHEAEASVPGVPIKEVVIVFKETLPEIVAELKAHGMLPPDFVMPEPQPKGRH